MRFNRRVTQQIGADGYVYSAAGQSAAEALCQAGHGGSGAYLAQQQAFNRRLSGLANCGRRLTRLFRQLTHQFRRPIRPVPPTNTPIPPTNYAHAATAAAV